MHDYTWDSIWLWVADTANHLILWIALNKEWLFSGAAFFLVSLIAGFCARLRRRYVAKKAKKALGLSNENTYSKLSPSAKQRLEDFASSSPIIAASFDDMKNMIRIY